MEQFLDYRDDEAEYLARRAKRKERMLQEKQRKRKQRMMLLGFFGVIFMGVVIIGFTGIFAKKAKADSARPQVQDEDSLQQNAKKDAEAEAAEVETTESSAEGIPQVYSFKEDENTTGIYSEAVISTHAILIDESTDTIVASKAAQERISPASMTKVLTVLVAAEQITEEDLDDTFTMTLEITDYSYVNDCSNVGILD